MKHQRPFLFLTLSLFVFGVVSSAWAQSRAGIVISLEGQAWVESSQGRRNLDMKSPIYVDEELVTGPASKVQILFEDDTILAQGESSRIQVDDYVFDPGYKDTSKLLFRMGKGAFRVISGKIAEDNPEEFNMESPLSMIGIRGTHVFAMIEPQMETIGVAEMAEGHHVIVSSGASEQVINTEGLFTRVGSDGSVAPPMPIPTDMINDLDSVAPVSEAEHVREQREMGHDQDPQQDREMRDRDEESEQAPNDGDDQGGAEQDSSHNDQGDERKHHSQDDHNEGPRDGEPAGDDDGQGPHDPGHNEQDTKHHGDHSDGDRRGADPRQDDQGGDSYGPYMGDHEDSEHHQGDPGEHDEDPRAYGDHGSYYGDADGDQDKGMAGPHEGGQGPGGPHHGGEHDGPGNYDGMDHSMRGGPDGDRGDGGYYGSYYDAPGGDGPDKDRGDHGYYGGYYGAQGDDGTHHDGAHHGSPDGTHGDGDRGFFGPADFGRGDDGKHGGDGDRGFFGPNDFSHGGDGKHDDGDRGFFGPSDFGHGDDGKHGGDDRGFFGPSDFSHGDDGTHGGDDRGFFGPTDFSHGDDGKHGGTDTGFRAPEDFSHDDLGAPVDGNVHPDGAGVPGTNVPREAFSTAFATAPAPVAEGADYDPALDPFVVDVQVDGIDDRDPGFNTDVNLDLDLDLDLDPTVDTAGTEPHVEFFDLGDGLFEVVVDGNLEGIVDGDDLFGDDLVNDVEGEAGRLPDVLAAVLAFKDSSGFRPASVYRTSGVDFVGTGDRTVRLKSGNDLMKLGAIPTDVDSAGAKAQIERFEFEDKDFEGAVTTLNFVSDGRKVDQFGNTFLEWGHWEVADDPDFIFNIGSELVKLSQGVNVQGDLTAPEDLDDLAKNSVVANYSGDATGQYFSSNDTAVNMSGSFGATIDFGSDTLSGVHMNISDGASQSIVASGGSGVLSAGGTFDVQISGASTPLSSADLNIQGGTFGPDAQAIAGTWDLDNGTEAALGQFNADKV